MQDKYYIGNSPGPKATVMGGGTDEVFVENDQVITQDYTIPAGRNASSTGDLTINNGVTVTISNGSNWAIL